MESLHQPTADPLWRESYYFNLLGSDLVVETTIGLRPGQNTVERMALVLYRDRVLIFIEPGRLAEFTPSALQADTIFYDCVVPLEQWHIYVAGQFFVLPPDGNKEITSFLSETMSSGSAERKPAVLDLTFQGLMPPYLYPLGTLDFLGSETHHYEQAGWWAGTIQVGDDTLQKVSGLGVRDHSWGVRDWLRAEEWYWANVLRPDEYLVVAHGRGEEGDWSGGGFVHTGGTTHPLRQISVKAQHDDSTPWAGEAQIEAMTDDGRSFLARIHRQRGVQFIPARGPELLLRMSTSAGMAEDHVWLLQHGRRERIGTKEG